ncbi:pectinesterase-like [Cornus florida]|uniref:pectinesterase-like n=1 Tax=Cornus florida TaxID=4283 RepID=UPI00289C9D89|nr:pectinesterase-like [Cornus florida]
MVCMDKHILLVLSAFLSVHALLLFPNVVHGDTITSCSQTPYPQTCNSFVSSTIQPQANLDETLFVFRESALRITMAQSEQAHSLVSTMDLSSFNERAKAAWADCLELYEDTISQLNRSIGSNHSLGIVDAQTWLSAAITNHQTCQNGFIDFNLSSLLEAFPLMLSDFSKLLSNSLAINKAATLSSSSLLSKKKTKSRRLLADDGFPEWVSTADRKLLELSGVPESRADIVVAKDGSGNYKTISEAVAASVKLRSGTKRFVIYVKKGVYKENVEIKGSMKNLMFIGDGIDATIVTGSKNVQDGSTTFKSATFAVSGDGFIAREMTFENTAGPQKHQAVALRSGSDLSVFYSCSFKGYQDTLYVHSQRQFYRNCDIYGTIDFIFGDAVTVLQNCNIYVRKPMSHQINTITAQGRSDPNENTGIVIHNSRVTASTDLRPVLSSFKTYLGRPWKEYSRTVFMKCSLDGSIDRAGWLPWSGSFALRTLFYGEYMNTGDGAGTGGRVRWPGYKIITSVTEAEMFTVGKFLHVV